MKDLSGTHPAGQVVSTRRAAGGMAHTGSTAPRPARTSFGTAAHPVPPGAPAAWQSRPRRSTAVHA